MKIEVIPQIDIGTVRRSRVGDYLNEAIASNQFDRFRFAVAYMRSSGIDRLSVAIESLVNRKGKVSGAVGIDDTITSIEALEILNTYSTDSSIFHTISGFIFHPKLYLCDGEKSATAIIGSPNLTRDGLYRNVELATAVHLDYDSAEDLAVYRRYHEFVTELLDEAHPNVQRLNPQLIDRLAKAGLIKSESQTREPGPQITRSSKKTVSAVTDLFPPLQIPAAPPSTGTTSSKLTRKITPGKTSTVTRPSPAPSTVAVPPATAGIAGMFLMQLSAFDSSHRTGVKGTPEVLVPKDSITFFPTLTMGGRKYPDSIFNVVLNTPDGREEHIYRLWYYEERATGKRIDEHRLRLDHSTIDLSDVRGGDLLIISKLPYGSDPAYEVTVLPQSDPTFPAFLAMCTRDAQGKKWGIV